MSQHESPEVADIEADIESVDDAGVVEPTAEELAAQAPEISLAPGGAETDPEDTAPGAYTRAYTRAYSGQISGMVRQATTPVMISSGMPTRRKSLNL